MTTQAANIVGEYKFGFHDDVKPVYQSKPGLSREVVEEISYLKGEPDWMREFRLRAYEIFLKKEMPRWANNPMLDEIDFQSIHYYVKAADRNVRNWDDVPEYIKRTFDRLGIPEA